MPCDGSPSAQDDAFYYDLRWSPDSKKVLFSDQKLNLWYVDVSGADAHAKKIATDNYDIPLHEFDPRWSPDSRWVVYTKLMPNYLHAIFIYSLSDGSTHQVTDASSDCMYPGFDAGGKYLYFTSSTDTGLAYGWLDMTSMERPLTRVVYAATLQAAAASPLAPRGGFESPTPHAAKPAGGQRGQTLSGHSRQGHRRSPSTFRGCRARAVPLPLPAANYIDLEPGEPRHALSRQVGRRHHAGDRRKSERAARRHTAVRPEDAADAGRCRWHQCRCFLQQRQEAPVLQGR